MANNAKSRAAAQKRNYEEMKDIKRRMDAKEETTYQERQRWYIYNSRKAKQ